MPIRLLLILAAALGACATGPEEALPVCDGHDRRPANPHGSILTPSAQPATADAAPQPNAAAPAGGCA